MADRRNVFIPLLILAFIFLSPDPARAPQSRFQPVGPTLDDVIAEEQRSLSELQNSTFQYLGLGTDRYPPLNLTGFENDRGYAWEALNEVQGRVQQNAKYAGFDASGTPPEADDDGTASVPLYRNVTGHLHGQWTRSKVNVQPPQFNLSEYAVPNAFGPAPRPISGFLRNITSEGGSLRVTLRQKDRQAKSLADAPVEMTAVEMEGEVTITDEVRMLDYEMRLPGVYFPEIGQTVLTTTSDKYAGIFALPHLTLSHSMFEASRALLNTTIAATIQRQINRETMSHHPWSSAPATAPPQSPFSSPSCELIVFLQQLSPVQSTAAYTSAVLTFLEDELRFPTGAFVPTAPELRFTMVAFSPDCGYVLESKGPPDYVPQEGTHLTGPKLEALHKQSRHHVLGYTLILGLQLFLLIRQMRESSTPSTRSRISYFTIGMLALGDGFTTMTFLLVSLFIGGLWINLVGTAFLAFISVSFFGMRFLLDVWTTQAPEREAVAREEAEQERQREERFRQALEELRQRQAARRAAEAVAAEGATADSTNVANAGNGADQTSTESAPPDQAEGNDLPAAAAPAVPAPPPTVPPPLTSQAPPAALPPPPSQTHPPPTQPHPPPTQTLPPIDTGATPIFMPSDQEDLVDPDPTPLPTTNPAGPTAPLRLNLPTFGAVYTRFYLLLLTSLFLSLNAISWPAPLRHALFAFLAFVYLSFWTPQIARNVRRNCRKALSWEYVVGQSVLRMMPMAYFFGYGGNVLFAPKDWVLLAVLGTWVWVQVVVLGSQELVGPRWFVPRRWALGDDAWDYHPVLREDEEGATLPIGFNDALSTPSSPVKERRRSSSALVPPSGIESSQDKDKSKRSFTCAICMQDLVVSIVASGESAASGPAGLLQRRQYMVTPCRHIFHSGCLEGWMKYRLVCPVCREGVPGL